MLSGQPQPSPPHTRAEGTEPDGRREIDPCEPIGDSRHDVVKSARMGPSEGSREHALIIECEFKIGELEQGALELQPSTRSPEQQRLIHRTPCSSSGVEEQENRLGVSNEYLERVSKDMPRNAGLGDVSHETEAARDIMVNPGPRQSLPLAPSALPLHLIPLLPQQSPSSKRQRRSVGLSSTQTDEVADDFSKRGGLLDVTGGTTPSPQSLRLRLSAESTGISRTLAYAMDQMGATHPSDYVPLCDTELKELVVTGEAEVDRERDVAIRPKAVRFEEGVCQLEDLAERLWTDALQAAATAPTHEGSEQKLERAAQSGEKQPEDEGATCGQGDATIGEKNTAGGKTEIPERDVQTSLRKLLGGVTLWKAQERQNSDATWDSELDAKSRCATSTEGRSPQTVDPEVAWRVEDAGGGTEQATLAFKPTQEYTRLKEREVELRNAGAEIRILEERLEAREKGLRNRLGTVRQRLEAVHQRRASINRQEEILRQKLEAVTKDSEAQGSASTLGANTPTESIIL